MPLYIHSFMPCIVLLFLLHPHARSGPTPRPSSPARALARSAFPSSSPRARAAPTCASGAPTTWCVSIYKGKGFVVVSCSNDSAVLTLDNTAFVFLKPLRGRTTTTGRRVRLAALRFSLYTAFLRCLPLYSSFNNLSPPTHHHPGVCTYSATAGSCVGNPYART